MTKAVVVVCVGNICRSPMAAILLQSRCPTLTVSSAGVAALIGEPAEPTAVALMAERNLDLGGHVGRQLDEAILSGNDMVLTMEEKHSRWIVNQWPQFRGRVFRIGHWGDFDVPDPYRRGEEAFRRALDLIDRGVDDWVAKLGKLTQ